MPYDKDKRDRRIPDFEDEPAAGAGNIDHKEAKADSFSGQASEPAAEFVLEENKSLTHISEDRRDSVSFDTDGIGWGPLPGIGEWGAIGEDAAVRPDFETDEPAGVSTEGYVTVERKPVDRTRPREKNNKRSKKLTAVLASIAGAGLVAALLWNYVFRDMWIGSNSDPVSVIPVSIAAGLEAGITPRYSGVVQPEKTIDVKKDAAKEIKEIQVSVGDEVTAGQPLFTYDTAAMEMSLRQAQFDVEMQNSEIEALKAELKDAQDKLSKAKEADKAYHEAQVSAKESDIRMAEYTLKEKQDEVSRLDDSIENAQVVSEFQGTVTEVNLSGQVDQFGQEKPFIRIQESSNLKITGTISEQNIGQIYEGQPMIIQSRLDETMTWDGVVEKIDFENPVSNQNGNMGFYDSSLEGSNQATKYNFFVSLNFYEGLHLGQHVYIEPVTETVEVQEEGLWIPAFYVVREETRDFVWVRNSSEKLEERNVVLGDYDSGGDRFMIVSGLEPEDYIASPSEECRKGVPTILSQENPAVIGGGADMGDFAGDGGEILDGGLYPNGGIGEDGVYSEDDVYGDETYPNDNQYDDAFGGDVFNSDPDTYGDETYQGGFENDTDSSSSDSDEDSDISGESSSGGYRSGGGSDLKKPNGDNAPYYDFEGNLVDMGNDTVPEVS